MKNLTYYAEIEQTLKDFRLLKSNHAVNKSKMLHTLNHIIEQNNAR